MKETITICCMLAMAVSAFSQTTIQGTVTDAETGEFIIFGTVAIYRNDTLITGTETDFDGFYSITEIASGTYEVIFSYTGYQDTTINGISIQENTTKTLDARIERADPGNAIIVEYVREFIADDMYRCMFTSDELKSLPIQQIPPPANEGKKPKKKNKRSKKLKTKKENQ